MTDRDPRLDELDDFDAAASLLADLDALVDAGLIEPLHTPDGTSYKPCEDRDV